MQKKKKKIAVPIPHALRKQQWTYQEPWRLVIHRGSEGQPGKIGTTFESTPAFLYSPNEGKLKD